MGRKKGAFHKAEPNAKLKTLPEKPAPVQPGTYGFKLTSTDGFGQFRDLKGVLPDMSSRDEATNQAMGKVPAGWTLVKLIITFIGLIAIVIPFWAAISA